VTTYVVPIVNPALMTLTNIPGRTDGTNAVSVLCPYLPGVQGIQGIQGTYTWNNAGSYTNGSYGIYHSGSTWRMTNAVGGFHLEYGGAAPVGRWLTNGELNVISFTSNWRDPAYGNPFTGEDYSGQWEVYPNQRFKGNIWVCNRTKTTNWHFGWVVYPVKWGESPPTITRINDYTVRIRKGDNDDTITINPAEPNATFTLDLTGSNNGSPRTSMRPPAKPWVDETASIR
jgi:hypothetical protein